MESARIGLVDSKKEIRQGKAVRLLTFVYAVGSTKRCLLYYQGYVTTLYLGCSTYVNRS